MEILFTMAVRNPPLVVLLFCGKGSNVTFSLFSPLSPISLSVWESEVVMSGTGSALLDAAFLSSLVTPPLNVASLSTFGTHLVP